MWNKLLRIYTSTTIAKSLKRCHLCISLKSTFLDLADAFAGNAHELRRLLQGMRDAVADTHWTCHLSFLQCRKRFVKVPAPTRGRADISPYSRL